MSNNSMKLYKKLKPLFFQFDPEWIHDRLIDFGETLGRFPPLLAGFHRTFGYEDPCLEMSVAGIRFPNPVGLAAGFDKNGRIIPFLATLGFGFIEIGSISLNPSEGNPKPRLFRLPMDEAVVVHYGLPNEGAPRIRARLRRIYPKITVPLGINLVNTNRGPDRLPRSPWEIIEDYAQSTHLLKDTADYICLNLSCPNTEAGKDFFLQKDPMRDLLVAMEEIHLPCPLFLKVSPAGGIQGIEALLEAVEPSRIVSGFVFNLPRGKLKNLKTPRSVWENLPGAVSGKPIRQVANTWIREMYRRMDRSRYVILGTGGVFSAEDAYEKIKLGASLVQILTSLPYEGPGVIKRINKGLCTLLERDGFKNISEAVGTKNLC
jgi:dihydroorotate dehydrogenase (fumarate)/dihydroorotate dehydrogenase